MIEHIHRNRRGVGINKETRREERRGEGSREDDIIHTNLGSIL